MKVGSIAGAGAMVAGALMMGLAPLHGDGGTAFFVIIGALAFLNGVLISLVRWAKNDDEAEGISSAAIERMVDDRLAARDARRRLKEVQLSSR